jgi:TolA-binding protein
MSDIENNEWPEPERENKFNWSLSMRRIVAEYGNQTVKNPILTKKAITPKVPWTKDIFEEKLRQVEGDIAEVNRKINQNQKRINEHLEIKKQLCHSVAKKWAYRQQLLDNIQEHFPDSLNQF